MMIELPVLLPNQDQMKLAESLDLDLERIDKVNTWLVIETAYIIGFWENDEMTHISIDGPPFEADICIPLPDFITFLAKAELKVVRYEGR
jgi:hypothetical protein